MRKIVRSALAREREIDGIRVLIEPPTVRDAFEVLATYEGYLKENAAAKGVFIDALRRWLPSDLFEVFSQDDADRKVVSDHVLFLILEGVPERNPPDKRSGESVSMEDPFMGMIGAYCRTYGTDPYLVYTQTPWPFFLLFASEVKRQEAMDQLRLIRASMPQHMTKEAFNKMFREIERDMRINKTVPDERKAAEQGLEMLQALKEEQDGRLR